jgi:Tfp pilus assembly protein PilF
MSEIFMRITALSAAAALTLLSVSTSLMAQRPDNQIDPKSLALLQEGRTALAAGDVDGAQDAIESAVVVDPRNRAAFVALADIARGRGLPGKAIRFYNEALALEPNDLTALRGQGEALVAKGAIEKAKQVLAKVRLVCGEQCGEATALAASIAKGPPVTATAQAAPATPAPAKP